MEATTAAEPWSCGGAHTQCAVLRMQSKHAWCANMNTYTETFNPYTPADRQWPGLLISPAIILVDMMLDLVVGAEGKAESVVQAFQSWMQP